MTIDILRRGGGGALIGTARLCLLRVAALAMFALGLVCWIRLVGVFDGPLWRFDLMPTTWRIVSLVLAVLYPIAGLGLWMAASWGPVVWGAAALVELSMVFAFHGAFGGDPTIAAAHLAGLAALAGLRLADWLRRRRADKV